MWHPRLQWMWDSPSGVTKIGSHIENCQRKKTPHQKKPPDLNKIVATPLCHQNFQASDMKGGKNQTRQGLALHNHDQGSQQLTGAKSLKGTRHMTTCTQILAEPIKTQVQAIGTTAA